MNIYPTVNNQSYGIQDKPLPVNEKMLSRSWFAFRPGKHLTTSEGREVIIIDGGRPNLHEGPDVAEATIFLDGIIISGSVEFHLNAAGWFSHGHHNDANYSNVILHVVGRDFSGKPRPDIPTVIIPANDLGYTKCELPRGRISTDAIHILKKLARKRWQKRISYFRSVTENGSLNLDKLRQEMFAVLGYGGNSQSFRQMAVLIDGDYCHGKRIQELQYYLKQLMESSNLIWHRCGVRPANHPESRLTLASRLLLLIDSLDASYAIKLPDFNLLWEKFIQPHAGKGIQTELLGNVFYPLIGAQAAENQDTAALAEVLESWFSLKLPYTYGFIEKRFGKMLKPAELHNFAIGQGLKQFRKIYCQADNCLVCPMKGKYGSS